VAENASRSESARTELHAPLKPADDLLVREQIGDLDAELLVRLADVIGRAFRGEHLQHIILGELRTEKRSLLPIGTSRLSRIIVKLIAHEQRRAKRTTRIARGRLNPDLLEGSFSKDAAVADAVQRYAAGQHEVPHPRLPVNVAGRSKHDLLGDGLQRSGQIHV